MKQFIKRILLFIVIFFILEKVSWFIVAAAPAKQFDRRIEALVNGNIEKDLIILGSSKGADNILACQLEEETGLKTFNLGYQGSNVNFHEFILKTLVKFNKNPKKVILVIDNPSQFIEDKTIIYRTDMLQPFTKYNYINNSLVKSGTNSKLSYIFYLSRLHKTHFLWDKKSASKNNPLDSCGSMPLLKGQDMKLVYNKTNKSYNQNEEDALKIKAFKSIQNICKQNHIELIYAFSPSFRAFNNDFYRRFKMLLTSEANVIIYDTLKPQYKNPKYFYDYSHLLKNGASIFTSEISTFINSNKQID